MLSVEIFHWGNSRGRTCFSGLVALDSTEVPASSLAVALDRAEVSAFSQSVTFDSTDVVSFFPGCCTR